VGYEQVRVTGELSRSVQRSVGVPPRKHETLGELIKAVAAERGTWRLEDLISEEPTRHEGPAWGSPSPKPSSRRTEDASGPKAA
jgi:hypothetical protein